MSGPDNSHRPLCLTIFVENRRDLFFVCEVSTVGGLDPRLNTSYPLFLPRQRTAMGQRVLNDLIASQG
ncbi:hypothetical protein BQ8794_210045 [Mesorhizobium prunaredense]|uniref:Uncharacterized protein n=1 Tax=Mesorhizobium prunaredense TaxID=1631249 RepID=A0A1R3V648_9HYPH|nr:hypothetical protein BQ8794_210045 [Mesorhizobium prunaredense]